MRITVVNVNCSKPENACKYVILFTAVMFCRRFESYLRSQINP